jgi:hypothetical protein
MNLFVLDENPILNAKSHNDRHVVKMILEATQIASTVLWLSGGEGPYRVTHKNHPVVKWAGASIANYRKTIEYGLALSAEYTHRFGSIHRCTALLLQMQAARPLLPDLPFAGHVYCGDPACVVNGDVVQSYRRYYLLRKRHIAQWTKREAPGWWA